LVLLLLLLRVAVVAGIAWAAWRLLSPRWAFQIVVDESGVRSHRGITTAQQQRLLELLQRTRFPEGRVKICGRCDEHGRLILQFYGAVSDETRQQIRNYIASEL